MYRPMGRAACLLTASLLAFAPLSTARAIEYNGEPFEPFMVMSSTSFDEIIEDVTWIAQTAGFDQEREMGENMAREFVRGVSFDAPMGMVTSAQNGDLDEPLILAFLPVDDVEPLLDIYEREMGDRPEPDEEGVYLLEAPEETIYARLEGDYLYFTNERQLLKELPSRPQSFLGDLPERYTFAMQFNLGNLPEQLREEMFEEVEAGYIEGFNESFEGTDDELSQQLREQMLRQQTESIMRMVRSAEVLTFGLGVDTNQAIIFLDAEVLAAEGSPMAESFARMAEVTTDHSGFLLPDAAVSLNFSGELSEEVIETLLQVHEEARLEAEKDIAESEEQESEAERELMRELTEKVFEVFDATISEGKLDGGAACVLEPESITFVSGMRVAEGEKLQDTLLRALEHDEDSETIIGESFEYAGVEFQAVLIPMEDEASREIFGEELELLFGFSDDAFYFGCGQECEAVMKAVLDGSQEAGPVKLPPFQLNVAITPIIRFAAAQTEDPSLLQLALMLETLGGQDRVMVTSSIIENGINFRLEIEQGVIEATGEALHGLLGGMQGAAPPVRGGF